MKLICTLGEFAEPASAALPRYCAGPAAPGAAVCTAGAGGCWPGQTQPRGSWAVPSHDSRASVRAVRALPGCKSPFQPVKPLSDVQRLMLLIPTSLVGQQPKEEIPVLLLQVVELVVGSRGAHW